MQKISWDPFTYRKVKVARIWDRNCYEAELEFNLSETDREEMLSLVSKWCRESGIRFYEEMRVTFKLFYNDSVFDYAQYDNGKFTIGRLK